MLNSAFLITIFLTLTASFFGMSFSSIFVLLNGIFSNTHVCTFLSNPVTTAIPTNINIIAKARRNHPFGVAIQFNRLVNRRPASAIIKRVSESPVV